MVNILSDPKLFENVKRSPEYKSISFFRENVNNPDDPIEIIFTFREILQSEYLTAMKISENKNRRGGTRSRKSESDELSVEDFGKRQVYIFNTCINNWNIVDLDPSEISLNDKFDPPQFSIWMLRPSEANVLMEEIVPSLDESDSEDVLSFRISRDRQPSTRTKDPTERANKIKSL